MGSVERDRNGGAESLDRALHPEGLQWAPGLCRVRVCGRCRLPGPELTGRGARRPLGPGCDLLPAANTQTKVSLSRARTARASH